VPATPDALRLPGVDGAGRAAPGAPNAKRADRTASAFGELGSSEPKDAPNPALGFDPYDVKSILGQKPSAGQTAAVGGGSVSPIKAAAPIMGAELPSSVAPASGPPALPSSVGPSAVGPSSPGGRVQ